jgi:hypothetical protein
MSGSQIFIVSILAKKVAKIKSGPSKSFDHQHVKELAQLTTNFQI